MESAASHNAEHTVEPAAVVCGADMRLVYLGRILIPNEVGDVYGVYEAPVRIQKIGQAIWLSGCTTAQVGLPLIPKNHFTWWPSEPHNRAALYTYGALRDIATQTRLTVEGFVSEVFVSRVKVLCPTYERTKEKIRDTLGKACENALHPAFHYSVVRRVLHGAHYEDAVEAERAQAGVSMQSPFGWRLTPPLFHDPLRSIHELMAGDAARPYVTPVPPCASSSGVRADAALTVFREIQRVNAGRLQYRRGVCAAAGFYHIPMVLFKAYERKYKHTSCFDALVQYVGGERLQEDKRQFLRLPAREEWGTSPPALLTCDDVPRSYIICDPDSLDREWSLRTAQGAQCCWNEVCVPGRVVTNLLLDIDLRAPGAPPTPEQRADIVESLAQLPAHIVRSVTGLPDPGSAGCVVVYHRPCEGKLSFRVLWKLPLQLCRWDTGGRLVREARRLSLAQRLPHLVQQAALVAADLGEGVSSLSHWYRRTFGVDVEDPCSWHCVRGEIPPPDRPFEVRTINGAHVLKAEAGASVHLRLMRAARRADLYVSAVDVGPYSHRKSVRLPLCDKPHNGGRFALHVVRSACFPGELQGFGRVPSDGLAAWTADDLRIFLPRLGNLEQLEKEEEGRQEDVQKQSVTLTEVNAEIALDRLRCSAGCNAYSRGNGILYTPQSRYCGLHKREHSDRHKHYYTAQSPDVLFLRCFVPAAQGEAQWLKLTWDPIRNTYFPRDWPTNISA
ncbi:ORF87 [Ranid herpesvirus 1]|uniref:ORF87 n=1 Tax=Ranid herpesvirus 1 TaxID=85655 RepID=Q9YQY0_9VIRU|nr:ORF87 [Ranid herpesvirus 1]AAD12285.1 ORF87 [Ranid herpesvirus 1]